MLAALLLVACNGPAATEPVPARLQPASESAQEELRERVRAATGQYQVSFGFQSLEESGVLLLERTPGHDPAGRRLPGRDLSEPERFELWLEQGQCVLRQLRTGEQWPLDHASCEPR